MFLNESRCRTAERCLRSYYWRYLHGGHGLGLRFPDKKLVVGNLVHAGLAAHYMEEPISSALTENLLRDLIPGYDNLDADSKNEWLNQLDWAERVCQRNVEWAAPRDNFAVVGVEQSGSVVLGDVCWQCGTIYPPKEMEWTMTQSGRPLSCPTCYAAAHMFVFRLDLLVRDDYGYRVIDHKTTASAVDEWYLKGWEWSTQLWGYAYGAQKQSGHKVGGYSINIIRKVKSAAEAPDLTKSCPGCGRKKAKGCEQCADSPTPGRVSRPPKPADEPFHREHFTFTPAKAAWFVESRVRLANKITEHINRLAAGDPWAFPHNPTSVGCDPDLCWGRKPGEPFSERFINEERYIVKGPDYVTEKQMSFEEGV